MRISIFVTLLGLSIALAGCSVVMSAQKSGISAEDISTCRTRACLLTKGAVPISSKTDKKGTLTTEDFKVQEPKGSAVRAGMHGALDVATFGVWEVVGTPIETVEGKKKYYIIHVTYHPGGYNVQSIHLVQ